MTATTHTEQPDLVAHPHPTKSIQQQLEDNSEKILEHIMKGEVTEADKLIQHSLELTTAFESVESDKFSGHKEEPACAGLPHYVGQQTEAILLKLGHVVTKMPVFFEKVEEGASHLLDNTANDLRNDWHHLSELWHTHVQPHVVHTHIEHTVSVEG